MASLAPLLRVQMLGAFGVGRLLNERDPRAKAKLALAAVGITALGVLAAAYAWTLGQAFVALGSADALPCLAVAASGAGCAFSAFAKANGLLFGFKDFDLVVSMPAPLGAVVVSRIAPLYGMGLAFSVVLGVPLTASYLITSGAGPAGAAVAALVLLLAPAIPLAVALALSFCVAWAASRTRFADRALGIVGVGASVAIVVGVMVATGGSGAPVSFDGESLSSLSAIGPQIEASVAAVWPPAAWAAEAMAGSAAHGVLFAVVSAAAGAATIAVLSRYLIGMNSLLSSGRARRARTAAARSKGARNPFAALVRKEFRLWVGTPIYLMNTAVGPVLAIVAAVGLAAAGPSALASAANVPGADGAMIGAVMSGAAPWVLALCMAMTSLSAASTSLEGSARWIAQTAPLPPATITGSKIATNLLVTAPAAVVAGVIAATRIANDPLDAALFVIAPLAGSALASCLGALLDARRPRFDWASAYEPVKRSANVGLCIGAGFLAVLAGIAATLLAGTGAGIIVAAAILAASACAGRAAMRIPFQDR